MSWMSHPASIILMVISASALTATALLLFFQLRKLVPANTNYQVLFEKAGDAIFILDGDEQNFGRILSVNHAAAEMHGYLIEELSELNIQDLAAKGAKDLQTKLSHMTGGEWVRAELEHRRKDGTYFPVEMHAGLVELDGHEKILAFYRDITERKEAEDILNYMAYYDSLTGLPNRMLFNGKLVVAIKEAKLKNESFAVMFLDLDNFKTINDTLGHTVGDTLLQEIAERLTGCLREDDIVARLGGDEFILLIQHIERPSDAESVASKIIDIFKSPLMISERDIFITTSIGIALYPNDGEDMQMLLRNADTALYRAKDLGRDNYKRYTPAMNDKALERLSLETDLRRALENNELMLFYQPQIDIQTSEIVGMEALLRWHHPEFGLIYPDDFISIAEDTGLVVPIGEWVLYEACRQNKEWQDLGYKPVRVAINLSARQFQMPNLVEMIDDVIYMSALDPQYLDVEITESLVVQDTERAIEVLSKLKERGIQISIDDFGTGYSALSHLKRFPIDAIKIDRMFVSSLGIDSSDEAIVEAVVAMGHSMKRRVVAEGVETKEQLEFLRQLKCDELQGFFFSQPIPAEKAIEFLHQQYRWCA